MSTYNVEVTEITQNLIQYRVLEKLDRVSYYTSAYVYHKNGQAIMIDSGYYDLGVYIKIDLAKRNINPIYIIISHYHRDHSEGSVLFNNVKIIASALYEPNYIKCQKLLSREGEYERPSILVNSSYELNFHDTSIHIIQTPGHTPCSLSVIIDKRFLFVGDLLLEDIHNKMIIPYIDLNSDPRNHLKSLRMLSRYEFTDLMMTHGPVIRNVNISYLLTDRIYYLERLIDSGFNADLEYCLIQNKEEYAMTEIHKLNIRNAKKLKLTL